jgi:hypothetical protein
MRCMLWAYICGHNMRHDMRRMIHKEPADKTILGSSSCFLYAQAYKLNFHTVLYIYIFQHLFSNSFSLDNNIR